MKRLLFAAVAATLTFGATAQQPAQPNPRDAVPDKMPNDIPYGPPISLARAQQAINAAVGVAEARMEAEHRGLRLRRQPRGIRAYGRRAAWFRPDRRAQGTRSSEVSARDESVRKRRTGRQPALSAYAR